jgi:sugar O-acyltransferase (sialic acid O-acetyltransferase NeuD family)
MQTRPHILLGAGGHARVVLSLAQALRLPVAGVCDPGLEQAGVGDWHGFAVLGDDTYLYAADPTKVLLLNGIGLIPARESAVRLRKRLHQYWSAAGFVFPACVHPTAWVAPDADLASGVQVMAGAVVQPGCTIGAGSIINTGATVDHDCTIGQQVHIAPGATLCGDIRIGDGAYIGAGATVINNLTIGKNALLAAGAVQIMDLPNRARSFGAGQNTRSPTLGRIPK